MTWQIARVGAPDELRGACVRELCVKCPHKLFSLPGSGCVSTEF